MIFFIFIALAALCDGIINNTPWLASDEDLAEPRPVCTACVGDTNRAHIIPAADIRAAWMASAHMRTELSTYCSVNAATDNKNKLYWCTAKPNWRPGDRTRNTNIGVNFDPAFDIIKDPAGRDSFRFNAATLAALELIKKNRVAGTYSAWVGPILRDNSAIRNSGACLPTDTAEVCRPKIAAIPEYLELRKLPRNHQQLLVDAFPACGYTVPPAPASSGSAWKTVGKSVAATLDIYPELTNVAMLTAVCGGALFGVYQLITRCGRKDELYYHSLVEHEDI